MRGVRSCGLQTRITLFFCFDGCRSSNTKLGSSGICSACGLGSSGLHNFIRAVRIPLDHLGESDRVAVMDGQL